MYFSQLSLYTCRLKLGGATASVKYKLVKTPLQVDHVLERNIDCMEWEEERVILSYSIHDPLILLN